MRHGIAALISSSSHARNSSIEPQRHPCISRRRHRAAAAPAGGVHPSGNRRPHPVDLGQRQRPDDHPALPALFLAVSVTTATPTVRFAAPVAWTLKFWRRRHREILEQVAPIRRDRALVHRPEGRAVEIFEQDADRAGCVVQIVDRDRPYRRSTGRRRSRPWCAPRRRAS